MGTDALVCIIHEGEFVLSQRPCEGGCPEVEGSDVWSFLRVPSNIEGLKTGVNHRFQLTGRSLWGWTAQANLLSPGFYQSDDSFGWTIGVEIFDDILEATEEYPLPVYQWLIFSIDYSTE